MKSTFTSISIIALGIILFACSSKKKSTTSTTTTTPTVSSVPTIIPGELQLAGIKAKYPEVTMEVLKEGHGIYIGACTQCHGQKNIYSRSEESWKEEIDEMAPKSYLTASQKDALYKYVMAMKSVQNMGK